MQNQGFRAQIEVEGLWIEDRQSRFEDFIMHTLFVPNSLAKAKAEQ